MATEEHILPISEGFPIWELDIGEVEGHNIETKGRDEVNEMLREGWVLLHIYTLKYKEESIWRERPMAILGKPRKMIASQKKKTSRVTH
jgi:hypothetical protein